MRHIAVLHGDSGLWYVTSTVGRLSREKSLSNVDAFQCRLVCAKTARNHLFHGTFTRAAAVAPVPVRVVARLVETHSNVSSPPVDHYNICEDDVERNMKKTCVDREPVAAPPFMNGDVREYLSRPFGKQPSCYQCACSAERKINQELGVL